MARYGALTLQLKNLSDLSNIGSTYTDIFSASGPQTMSGVDGTASFTFSARSATLYAAVTSNVGQVAYVYITDQVAGGAAMDVATFIIDDIDTSTSDDGAMVTVSGPGLGDQLTYVTAGDSAIDNGAGGESSTDLDDIMSFAPSGWTYTATGTGSGTRSSTGSYHASAGDNVMELLIATTKRSGDIFRLSSYSPPAKTISWRASPDSSGVTLRMPQNPTDYEGSTTTGIIYSLTEKINVGERLTGIRPYAAGIGGGRIDITDIDSGDTGGDPSGYTTTFASNLIVNTTLETALGYQKRLDVDLSAWQASDTTDPTQLTTVAVQLWNAAINYLADRDSSKKYYSVTCNVAADLRPGQTVTLDYDEYEGGTSGGTNVINISGSYTIQDVENSVGSDGIRMTTLTISDTVAKRPTAARAMANAVDTARKTTRKSNINTSPGAVSTSRTLNATQPVRIDGGGAADLSANRTLSINGLSSVGTANQIPGTNAAGTAWEYKTVSGGVTHAANSITVHDPVTLATGLDNNLLALTGQQLGLDTQSANLVFAGPSSGGAAAPSFRALVDADVPSSIARSNLAFVTIGNTASLSAERALVAGAGLTLTDGGGNGNATIDVVAANTSLIINADSMQVRLATNSGLTVSSGLTLGTPTTLTASSTNAVSGTAHSHAIDSSIARSAITVTGTGALGGGGALTANQAITMNTPGTLSVSSTSASSTNHTHAITSSSAVTTATATLLATDSNGRSQVQGLGVGVAASGTGILDVGNKIYINETADANVTIGIVINQGANDDFAISLKSSDVAQGATDRAEADNWGYIKKFVATGSEGGMAIEGLTEGNRAVGIVGTVTTEDTSTFSTATVGAVEIRGHTISGTSVTTMSGTAAVFIVKNNTGTKFVVDGNGNIHMDATSNINAWDDHDDLELITGLRGSLVPELKARYGEMVKQMRPVLEAGNIATFNDHPGGDGSIFLNIPNALFLTMDGVRQVYDRLDSRLQSIERRLLNA